MVQFTAMLKRYEQHGEKTGWTYIDVPTEIAQKLKPNNKKSFRVKVGLDNAHFEGVALVPMGEGDFIMAINATMRKAIGKIKGDTVKISLEIDENPYQLNADFIACLEDEPKATAFFNTLPKGHQNYFSKWIESAKTDETKAKRIAQSVNALSKKLGYAEMIRFLKGQV
ncbi:YdeI/OmpD-associated family protein [Parasediminibacterium sp. JCM 36343]|uniref:YdeI/OmpD-associated family protein n=1 Tax=Parasediminibacterium sp. JCM 36343 TaxID=3374279 RepID=UPI00397B8396